MRRLEDPVTGHVVDVAAGRDPDSADLRGERVRQVVAVQVGGRDDIEVFGPGQHLLQRDVGDAVLYEDLVARLAVAVVPADRDVGELLPHELVAPVAKRAFGELLDVPLVHERDTRAIVLDGVLDRGADQTLGTRLRDRLDADSGVLADGPAEALLQQRDELVGLGCSLFELEARVDVFGVLAEDHHVDGLGALHRRRHAREPPHGAKAHVQVEELTQRDVE